MKKELFAALLLLLLVAVQAQAQWSWLHPSPQGNNINKLSFLNTSTGWAAGDKGALIKTTNGGSSWALQYPGHIDDITELQFTDSLHGFMTAGSDLYYSSNSGTSWSIRFRFPSYIISALCMVDADSGVLAVKNGSSIGQLYKTTDGGLSWQQILPNTPGDINDIALTTNGNGMLVGSGALSMRTTDFGTTWNFVGIASAVEFIDVSMPSGQNIYIASAAQIFQSTDAGVTFTPIGNPAQTAGTNLLSIDFVNLNNGVVGSEAGNIFFTSDGGANWNSYLSNDWFNALDVVANTSNNFIVAGTNGSILKSTNGGTAWNELSSRVSETRLNGIETISSTEAFAAGVSGTILHTTNSGVTWTPQASNAGGEDLHDILL
jgi:photosystem II stability/assembly factor-like uncharacterized protein